MQTEFKDYALLHFIVVIWGFTAILGRLIEVPSVEIVFYRTMVASMGLYLLLKFRKRSFRLEKRDTLLILGTGVLISAHWILFFAAARVATVSVCLAGMATCSLWTSIIEPLATKRKIRPFEIVLSMVAIAGIVVIFRVEFNHTLGLIMAIVSAALSAIFTVINAGFTRKYNPYMITFYEMIGACLSTALFFPIYTRYFTNGELQLAPSSMDWLYLVILALACTVYAYSVSVELMKRLSAFVVNLTVNLEPVYGIILALLIFGDEEEMSGGFYLGTGLILVSVLVYPLVNRYFKRKALETDVLR